jgi:hypothetical protein
MLVVQLLSIPLGCSAEITLRFTSEAQIEPPGYVLQHQLPQPSQVSCTSPASHESNLLHLSVATVLPLFIAFILQICCYRPASSAKSQLDLLHNMHLLCVHQPQSTCCQ